MSLLIKIIDYIGKESKDHNLAIRNDEKIIISYFPISHINPKESNSQNHHERLTISR